jgi:hypothetical protein
VDLDPYAPPAAPAPQPRRTPEVVLVLLTLAALLAIARESGQALVPYLVPSDDRAGSIGRGFQWGGILGLGAGGVIALAGARRSLLGAQALGAAVIAWVAFGGGAGGLSIALLMMLGGIAHAGLMITGTNALVPRRAVLVVYGLFLAGALGRRLALPMLGPFTSEPEGFVKGSAAVMVACVMLAVVVARAPEREHSSAPPAWRAYWPRVLSIIQAALPAFTGEGGIGEAIARSQAPRSYIEASATGGEILGLIAGLVVCGVRSGRVRTPIAFATALGIAAFSSVGACFNPGGSLAWPLLVIGLVHAGISFALPFVYVRLYAGVPSRFAGFALFALTLASMVVHPMTLITSDAVGVRLLLVMAGIGSAIGAGVIARR